MKPTERIPCSACGAKILPTTAAATGGICMPCKNTKLRETTVLQLAVDSVEIGYTVCPSWGGFSKVYHLFLKENEARPVLRYQNGSAMPSSCHPRRAGFHRVFEEYEFIEVAEDCEVFKKMVSHLATSHLPALAEQTAGFDGADYGFRVKRLMTTVEFRWSRKIPKEWKESLNPVICTLQRLSELAP